MTISLMDCQHRLHLVITFIPRPRNKRSAIFFWHVAAELQGVPLDEKPLTFLVRYLVWDPGHQTLLIFRGHVEPPSGVLLKSIVMEKNLQGKGEVRMDSGPNDKAANDVFIRVRAELCRCEVGSLKKLANEWVNRESQAVPDGIGVNSRLIFSPAGHHLTGFRSFKETKQKECENLWPSG